MGKPPELRVVDTDTDQKPPEQVDQFATAVAGLRAALNAVATPSSTDAPLDNTEASQQVKLLTQAMAGLPPKDAIPAGAGDAAVSLHGQSDHEIRLANREL